MVSRVGQLDKFARCMDKIVALGATPKAILVSGGGDDIAGKEFGMLINNIDLHSHSRLERSGHRRRHRHPHRSGL